jgi:hypothetical protein
LWVGDRVLFVVFITAFFETSEEVLFGDAGFLEAFLFESADAPECWAFFFFIGERF